MTELRHGIFRPFVRVCRHRFPNLSYRPGRTSRRTASGDLSARDAICPENSCAPRSSSCLTLLICCCCPRWQGRPREGRRSTVRTAPGTWPRRSGTGPSRATRRSKSVDAARRTPWRRPASRSNAASPRSRPRSPRPSAGQAGHRHPRRVRRPAGAVPGRGAVPPAAKAATATGRPAGITCSASRRPRRHGHRRADQGRDDQGDGALLRLPGRGRRGGQGVHGPGGPVRRLRRRACTGTPAAATRPATRRAWPAIAVKFRFHGTAAHASGSPETRPVGPRCPDADHARRRTAPRAHPGRHAAAPHRHVRRRGRERRPRVRRGVLLRPPSEGRGGQPALPAAAEVCPGRRLATETKLEVVNLGGTMELLPNDTLARSGQGEPDEAERPEVRRRRR